MIALPVKLLAQHHGEARPSSSWPSRINGMQQPGHAALCFLGTCAESLLVMLVSANSTNWYSEYMHSNVDQGRNFERNLFSDGFVLFNDCANGQNLPI